MHPDAGIAQLVERLICNQDVAGSNPAAGTTHPRDGADHHGRGNVGPNSVWVDSKENWGDLKASPTRAQLRKYLQYHAPIADFGQVLVLAT